MTNEERAKNVEKSRRRRAEMQLAAERDGFEKASEAITAWKKGEYILINAEKFERLMSLIVK